VSWDETVMTQEMGGFELRMGKGPVRKPRQCKRGYVGASRQIWAERSEEKRV